MDASGIALTCPNPTIPMLSIERLCPLGAQSSAFTFPIHNIKRYRRTATCSTTVHQGVKDISHSYQKVGRMNEESKGLPEVGWASHQAILNPPQTKIWQVQHEQNFLKSFSSLSIGVVHLTSATLISLKFEPIWPWV
jgi:hypothetical protein